MSLKVATHKPLSLNVLVNQDPTLIASYIPQYLFIKEASEHAASICSSELPSEPLKRDLWGFGGWYWHDIIKQYRTVEALYDAIRERHSEIAQILETYRPLIEAERKGNLFYDSLFSLSNGLTVNGTYQIDPDRLKPISDGISGSYFLVDESGTLRFVVKPLDEDIGCINNRKRFATPFTMSPVRDAMPLYRSSLREVLAYQVASAIGVSAIAPQTALAIFESGKFYDLSEQVKIEEQKRYFEELGLPVKEKICSVQEFVPESKTLFEALQDLQALGLTNEEIANRFDQSDYEDTNILLWTTYDTDAHSGNILVYPKGTDELGNERLGLKKIDNGLAFPDENKYLRNALANHANAYRPLSDEGRAKIAAIDLESLVSLAEAHGLQSAIPALRERIPFLKQIAEEPGITLHTINRRMERIGRNQ